MKQTVTLTPKDVTKEQTLTLTPKERLRTIKVVGVQPSTKLWRFCEERNLNTVYDLVKYIDSNSDPDDISPLIREEVEEIFRALTGLNLNQW